MREVVIWRLRQESLVVKVDADTDQQALEIAETNYDGGCYDRDAYKYRWEPGDTLHQSPKEPTDFMQSPMFDLGDEA